MERWKKTLSMCLEASHHEAQKCMITGEPLATKLSSSAFDCTSFTDPLILSQTHREIERLEIRDSRETQTLEEDLAQKVLGILFVGPYIVYITRVFL